uniref:Diaminohydroxyphosphoribosylaminopyrimidine deaminase n=1 Tax=Candidatus Kentrum sp. LFY TaxID=2126342 RepID=A0A450X4D7_9GAMM|nr:MAG: diaminohydroxyphosphoribosylaminopyrimidine deaminase [Candidatus Kentron sp. LFY]
MQLAIREARRSIAEDDRIRPKVGAVAVKNGVMLASSCRGDQYPGDHAEFGLLEKKLKNETLAGTTIFTTLEPCTTRNHPKIPCADRLIERRVSRVVVGMLDPDQRITGKGILRLREAGIAVDFFPPELMSELEELNREFSRECLENAEEFVIPGAAEAGLSVFYASRRHYSKFRKDTETIDRYIGTAKKTIIMVSVNLMTGIPFDELCERIKERIRGNKDFQVTISLLDPNLPELMSVMSRILDMESDELSETIQRSFRALLDVRNELPNFEQDRFTLAAHPTMPFGSAILLDHHENNGRIQIESKPYRAGLQHSFGFELCRAQEIGLYEVLVKAYETLIADGRTINGVGD